MSLCQLLRHEQTFFCFFNIGQLRPNMEGGGGGKGGGGKELRIAAKEQKKEEEQYLFRTNIVGRTT